MASFGTVTDDVGRFRIVSVPFSERFGTFWIVFGAFHMVSTPFFHFFGAVVVARPFSDKRRRRRRPFSLGCV